MQLKKIILKGFKSFPEKTTLEFDAGVTAIVGPNGSGKSNIIEAIRWVMGEQSAKNLRGDRMDDIIFSGTGERKAINIAEVELILDNSNDYLDIEYEEVSILRRLSRTRGSTYMINQNECRLKDIVDLFMDSGLGKESFSVISQGEVEAIFNSKPEDRRGIFEEAAGVFKYKIRKENAEKKLEETEDNLDRVQDILYELKSQLAPLKEQADRAEKYLEYREELTDLDIAFSVQQIKQLDQEMKKDQDKLEEIIGQLSEKDHQRETTVGAKKKQEKQLNELRDLAEKLSHDILKIVREKERLEASLNLFDEKSKHKEEFIKEKESSLAELSTRNQEEEKKLKDLTVDYNKQQEVLKQINQEVKELEKRRSYLEGDTSLQIEDLRNQYIDQLQEQTSLKNESLYLEQELSRNQIEKARKDEEIFRLETEIEKNKQELAKQKERYDQMNEELTSLLADYQEGEQLLSSHEKEFHILGQELSSKLQDLERAKAKAISLQEMQENYSGYYAGVRSVMKKQRELTGIVGTVAESLVIPEKYLLAINTALGSSGQFIIVEHEKDAREAIGYLKDNQKGRATFLPLTTINPRRIQNRRIEKIKAMPGYLGIANEVVNYPDKVKQVIDNLLGQTILAENLNDANAIARKIHFSHRVVSLEGDVIHAGGSMTGGGRRNNLNPIFSQKAELNHLENFIEENEERIDTLSNEQRKIEQDRITLKEKVETIRSEGETKRLVEQQTKNEIEHLETELNRLKRELKVNRFEAKEKNELLKEYNERLNENKGSLVAINQDVTSVKQNVELLTSEQKNIEQEREKIIQELEMIQKQRNQVREELAREKTKMEHHNQQIKENNKQIQKLTKEIKAFGQDLENISKEEIITSFDNHREKERELLEKQAETRKNIQQANEDNEKLELRMNQLSEQIKSLNDQKSKMEINISRNDVRMDYLFDYLTEEYQMSFEEARLLEKPEGSLVAAKTQVQKLKKKIDDLGSVNIHAIEEFNSVNERYEFLSKQQNDLLDAKNTLFDTMDDMDLIVEKQFKETFDQVKAEFAKVFPKMFDGGHAELVLNNPDNLLETGIDIIAQPPGKRLTQLSLLSGGERALTAISLLFAIIQVNPIPFVILDEAEAALDDANVLRFGKYLQNFEEKTQFIVITHRKGTMEHSDQLYGITMQEQGVSKVVGVSLNEATNIEGVT